MIHPIRKFSTRGVIWYQGEENALTTKDAFEYRTFFPLMVKLAESIRGSNLPFPFVQLPKRPRATPGPALRESQLHNAKTVAHTGMVVTVDVVRKWVGTRI